MRSALALGARGLGQTAPNPCVGALIVRGKKLLGRGRTGSGGRPHAETAALAQTALAYGPEAARGATAYVSLEPCAHHGMTPPCADALIAAGVARVVVPLEDPDPRVSGRGLARLRSAGVAVETGVLAAEAERIHAGFLLRHRLGRPLVTLKLATTLDGRIATSSGESRWITGPASRHRVHLMRSRSDGVVVGGATAQADDPMLNVRGLGDAIRQPTRIVLDPRLELAPTSRLAATARAIPVWAFHSATAASAHRDALLAAGVKCLPLPPGADGRLPLPEVFFALGTRGLTRVLVEGGGRLGAALLGAGLVDRIALFQAGKAIGGDGLPSLGPLGLDRLAAAPKFRLVSSERAGEDLVSHWHPA